MTAKKKAHRASVEKAFHPRRILVPVDFSDPSRDALEHSVVLARQFRAQLRLLYVVEPPPYPEFGYARMAAKETRLKNVARDRLQTLRREPPLKALARVSLATRYGRASMEIVEEARQWPAELIVQSTHGYSGLLHVVMGSTAERVVREAPCPVYIVRTPGTPVV